MGLYLAGGDLLKNTSFISVLDYDVCLVGIQIMEAVREKKKKKKQQNMNW